MAVKGVYPKPIQEMLDRTNKRIDEMIGWGKAPTRMVANEESVRNMARAVDPWNPLWRDDNYAASTMWGGVIAFPMYQEAFGNRGIHRLDDTPECGFQNMIYIGDDWVFARPVKVNDSVRVWYRRPQIVDVTDPDGKGPHTFMVMESDRDFINQNNELISSEKLYVQRCFIPAPPEPYAMPEYGYTREELLYIDKMVRAEEIRGGKIRYWEDVNEGDETKPVVQGPTSMADNAIVNSVTPSVGSSVKPREAFVKDIGDDLGGEFIKDAATNLYYVRGGPAGRHWSDRAAQAEGEPCAFLFAVVSRYSMTRLITNWMGDDGFLKKFSWRHVTRTRVGDCSIGHGKVVKKYVENGEHFVDLIVWLENMRGNITEISSATVRLLSRKNPPVWK